MSAGVQFIRCYPLLVFYYLECARSTGFSLPVCVMDMYTVDGDSIVLFLNFIILLWFELNLLFFKFEL